MGKFLTKKDKQVDKFAARKNSRALWKWCLFPPFFPFVLIGVGVYSLFIPRRNKATFVFLILAVLFTAGLVYVWTALDDLEEKYAPLAQETAGAIADIGTLYFGERYEELLPEIGQNIAFLRSEIEYIDSIASTSDSEHEYYLHCKSLREEGILDKGASSDHYFYYVFLKPFWDREDYEFVIGANISAADYKYSDYLSETEYNGIKIYVDTEYLFEKEGVAFYIYDPNYTKASLYAYIDELNGFVDEIEDFLAKVEDKYGATPDVGSYFEVYSSASTELSKETTERDFFNDMVMYTGIGVGVSIFLAELSSLIFACKGKELRKKVGAIEKDLDLLGGKPLKKQFEKELCRASRKRDVEAFYAETERREEEFEAAFPSLPFKSKREAREGINEIVMRCAVTESKEAAKQLRKQCKELWKNRDHQKLAEYRALYADKYAAHCEALVREAEASGDTKDVEFNGESRFDGNIAQKFGWDVLCFVVKWLTLTIAKPATECWKQKWYAKHTVIDGNRLSFDGSGAQLFGKRAVNALLTIVTLGIYAIFSDFSLDKWVAKHTHVDGGFRPLGGTFDGNAILWLLIRLGCFILDVCTLFIAKPFTICWKEKWFASHCIYDGKRTSFDGKGVQLMGKWMLWWLLTIVTFGIYSVWVGINVKKWIVSKTHFEEGYVCAF